MKFNSLLPALVSGITLSSIFLAGVLPANAVTLNYDVNGTFKPSFYVQGPLSGTFSADSATQSLTDYNISPGNFQFGAPGNSFINTANSFTLTNGGRPLGLTFDGSIFDPPSSGVLNVVEGYYQPFFSFSRTFLDSGIATLQPTQPIPEPISIVGTLIGGGAVWRMRKKLTASTKVKVKQ